MNEEQIIDKVSMIDQWKVSGDSYTQGELDAIGQLLELYYDNKKQLEQEKEKNNELEIELSIRDNINVDKLVEKYRYYRRLADSYQANCISKDKIKEKIEDYEKMIKATFEDTTWYGQNRRDKCYEILRNLNELLEGK